MATPDPSPSPEQKSPPPKPSRDPDHLVGYFKLHAREIIAYVLLILGIVLLFFDSLYGGILVGLVAGIYFGEEIVDYLYNWKSRANTKETGRHLICAGIVLAFFISAPAIFLGAALAIGLGQLFMEQRGGKSDKDL